MRIVLDLQACQASNRERGIGRYALSLAHHLTQLAQVGGRRHDVRIVLSNRFPDSVDALRATFSELVPREQISVFDLPSGLAGADPGSQWRARAAERIREQYLASLRPDIVHVASLFEGWGDDACTSVGQGELAGGATAVTLYDLIPLVREQTYLADPRMREWYYRKLQSLKSAGLLLAISGHSRDEALAALHLPAEQVVNISSAIDPVFAPRTLDAATQAALRQRYGLHLPYLMYTGGIDPRKNIEGLIAAFAALPAPLRNAHQLAIVCNVGDTDRKRLASLARECGLPRSALVLTGYVPQDDLVALYNLASAFVFPSLHEGFGLPVLEAMACGVPVIGANASSIPEVLDCPEALFDPNEQDAISAALANVLSNDALRVRLRSHGLAQATKFSWHATAERALHAFEQLHERRAAGTLVAGADLQHAPSTRPRLAFLSPLPPDQSGIADYSAALLAELVADYDIDVVAQSEVSDPWVLANCRIRSVDWFAQHGASFERILYHFGNSSFHAHMFDLLARFPGVVVLHDFFLSGILNYLDHTGHTPHALGHGLYDSHGYAALLAQQQDRQAAIWAHPCNRQVLADAQGVIVHSRYAQQLAEHWYGAEAARDWAVVPFPRALGQVDRAAARQRLGLPDDAFVTCSFGLLGAAKLNDQLLAAWLASSMATDPRAHLVFVGENDPSVFGAAMRDAIAASGCAGRITITGFAARATYLDYLAATDCAVQLRSKSRGETSAAIMDCLACGVPTIANANGSAAELPEAVLRKLPDAFAHEQLRDALSEFHDHPARMRDYSSHARAFLASHHDPHRVARQYRDVIERSSGAAAGRRRLLRGLARLETGVKPADSDWAALAAAIALNAPPAFGARQLLVDISELVQRDAKSGIQRVVRNVLECLLAEPPAGYRVEAVYSINGQYRYARSFTCAMLGLPSDGLDDHVIESAAGDVFLGLDLEPQGVPNNQAIYVALRNRGVGVYFVVYDLLPVLRPEFFDRKTEQKFGRWLAAISRVSDGLICISRAVADELAQWLTHSGPARAEPVKIGHFHLGADIRAGRVSTPLPQDEDQMHPVLAGMQRAPSLLMVGTLEPRKGHAQALAAFDLLWQQGVQANLVIVGKHGWKVDALVKRIKSHPENGKRLFWAEGAPDDLLLQIYSGATALLAPSEGEGFGLPLIEAAQHGLPVIARDLPVFEEVAGTHAFYFSGTAPQALAARVEEWLRLHAQGRAPQSDGMPWLTWAQSAHQLMEVIEEQRRPPLR